MDYPCKGCGAPARYELLPLKEGSLRVPSYWCRACWERSSRRSRHMEESMRMLRDLGAVRDLEPGGDAGEPEDGGQGPT